MSITTIPETGFLRLPAVLAVIPVCRASWWKGIKSGRYPQGVKLSERVTAWRAEDIRRLINTLGAPASDTGSAEGRQAEGVKRMTLDKDDVAAIASEVVRQLTTADLAQIEALIRRVIREEGMTYSGASLVSPTTEQQEAARRDAEREIRMARNAARRDAKKINGGTK